MSVSAGRVLLPRGVGEPGRSAGTHSGAARPMPPNEAVTGLRAAIGTPGESGVALHPFFLRAVQIARDYPAIGYVTAFASIAFATTVQWLARDLYQGAPFLLVYPAIVLTALVGGYRAGLLSVALAGLSQWYLFIPAPDFLAIATYALDATLGLSVVAYVNRSLAKEIEAKEHQRLLKDELRHRLQNVLTIIQGVIRFSRGDNVPVFPSVIEDPLLGRIQAMLEANQYVGDASGNVALVDLIRGQIRGLGGQAVVRGRPHLMLDPRTTQNFSLVLYELVTNSLKYGALSTSRGRVQIELTEKPAGVAFVWSEIGGPAVTAPPEDGSGDGFGSRILGSFARSFCAEVDVAYDPSGFCYRLLFARQQA